MAIYVGRGKSLTPPPSQRMCPWAQDRCAIALLLWPEARVTKKQVFKQINLRLAVNIGSKGGLEIIFKTVAKSQAGRRGLNGGLFKNKDRIMFDKCSDVDIEDPSSNLGSTAARAER